MLLQPRAPSLSAKWLRPSRHRFCVSNDIWLGQEGCVTRVLLRHCPGRFMRQVSILGHRKSATIDVTQNQDLKVLQIAVGLLNRTSSRLVVRTESRL